MVGVAILGAGDIANVHIEAYKELAGRCRIVALISNCPIFAKAHIQYLFI